MFFKKQKKETLEEAPLGYWEEQSYMSIIPKEQSENPLVGMFDRIENIEGLEIIEKKGLTIENPGYLKLQYENEEYEIGFYPNNFELQPFYITTAYHFEKEELEELKKAEKAMTIFMKFQKDSKKSYHLQLKIAQAIVPNMLALLDESAEKILPSRWVFMAASSNIVPSANDLYSVQAVINENNEVWLHTHGLCRCGLTELEILQSDKEHYNQHYNLISTFASFLIDKNSEFNYLENSAYIGILLDRTPVVVTCLSWTKALKEYPNNILGGLKDREQGHNSKTSIIFLYKSEEDEKQKILSKVSIYNNLWGDNPIFFISNEETARMKALAIERFHFVKEQFENKENKIIIKIGLKTNGNDNYDLEHIWFELLEFKKDKFKAKLTQEPYNVDNMHTGDEAWFTVDDVTDWVIYTKEKMITPGNSYLLI